MSAQVGTSQQDGSTDRGGTSKRTFVETEINDEVETSKRMKLDSTCSEESAVSLQSKATEVAKDESDLDWSDGNEYEVEEFHSEQDNPVFQDNSFSSDDDQINMQEVESIAKLGAVVATVIYNSDVDLGLNGDVSTLCSATPDSLSDEDADPELNRVDLWDYQYCAQCKKLNTNPCYMYCKQCYMVRKSFYPPRPKHKKKTIQKREDSQETTGEVDGGDIVDGGDVVDSGDVVDGPISKSNSQDSGCDMEEFNKPSSSQVETKCSDDNLCRLCYVKPIRSVFVHGKDSCIYSCYSCALKAWASIGCCPFCKAKVNNVLKIKNSINISIA